MTYIVLHCKYTGYFYNKMLSDCYLTLEICYYLCKKINMKGRHIKILTIFGLIAIIALQTIWLCNAYIQFSQSIYKDSNDIFKEVLKQGSFY